MFRTVILLAALATGIVALGMGGGVAAEINDGTVEYKGEGSSQGVHTSDGAGHLVPDGYVNNGTATAIGADATSDPNYGASGIWVEAGDFTNNGDVTASGGEGRDGGSGGYGIRTFVFTNYGNVTATGGNATAMGSGGNGIEAGGAGANYGSITANGGEASGDYSTGGTGITCSLENNPFNTPFTNHGEIRAKGGKSHHSEAAGGSGFNLINRDFINYGNVTATGADIDAGRAGGGSGLVIGGGSIENKGYMFATGGNGTKTDAGYGVRLTGADGERPYGFTNADTGTLVISGKTTAGPASLALDVSHTEQTATFKEGSTLVLMNGGRIDMNVGLGNLDDRRYRTNALKVESGAQLLSTEALDSRNLDANNSVEYEKFIVNADVSKIEGGFLGYYNNPIIEVDISTTQRLDANGYTYRDYTATFTRKTDADGKLLYASDIVTGEARQYMAAIEGLVVNNPDALNPDDPRFAFALLYATTEQKYNVDEIRTAASRLTANARRQVDPRAAAAAVPSFNRVSRLAGSVFADRLRLAATLPQDNAGASLSALSGNAYASLAPGGTRRGAVAWATPFYQRGDLDGDSGYGDLRERMGGVALGGALIRGDWAFGLSAHLLKVDFDGYDGYDADAMGYGANLGLARRFGFGSLAPLFELTGGYTFYDFDQERHGVDLHGNSETYRSNPYVHVLNASALLSNRFDFGRFSLTPRVGADYARADMRDYSESGGSTTPRVRTEAYNSFRSVLGAAVSIQATPCIRFEARADYHHEFADARSRLTARDTFGLISVNGRSHDVGRESGRLGFGVQWRPTERAELGLDYDLDVAKNYVGHRLSAQVKLAF